MAKRAPKEQPPTLRQSIQEHTRTAYREAILDAAERVFVRVGFSDAKMADIAAEAGASVGTLYNHFDSKEAVVASIAGRCHGQYTAAVLQGLEGEDPMAQLRSIVQRTLEFIESRGALFALYVQLSSAKVTELRHVGGQQAEDNYLRFLAALEETMKKAVAAGLVRGDIGTDVLAAALASMVNGMLFTWVQKNRRDRLADSAEVVMKLFLEGARAK
jgi:AcrR family transcriptional regulator